MASGWFDTSDPSITAEWGKSLEREIMARSPLFSGSFGSWNGVIILDGDDLIPARKELKEVSAESMRDLAAAVRRARAA